MWPGRFFWKLFLGNALLVVAAIVSLSWVILDQIETRHLEDLTRQLQVQATTLRHAIGDRFGPQHAAELDALANELRGVRPAGIRVTFVAADGAVLGDSAANPSEMESHADRPEIRRALQAGWGESTRWSHTVRREMMYVAVRAGPAERPAGVVRVSMPVPTIGARLSAAERPIWIIGAIALVTALALALGLASLWSGPIGRVTAAARSMSRGDLSARAEVTGSDELGLLARSLNEMRGHLAGQLATIDRQRRTLESLLAQLHEGVIVAGPDGTVALINPAAVRLLNLTPPATQAGEPAERPSGQTAVPEGSAFAGRTVEQCIPQHELQQMLLTGPARRRPASEAGVQLELQEAQIEVPAESGTVSVLARASAIALPGPQSNGGPPTQTVGRLLVLTDVSELARTIQLKSDFVANASHELRTPVSAIRAALETLLQLDLAAEAEPARRFVGMIDRHSRRLEQMVADLLDLSRLEAPATQFRPVPVDLRRIMDELYAKFEEPIKEKRLQWQTEVAPGCESFRASPELLRLVLDNLVDNAVTFTGAGGRVRVSAAARDAVICIQVADDGCGIPEEEQQRVFERFYQVDRARSSGKRGTGLGLAIVKHAVAALGGTVDLDSRVGEGTRVTVTLARCG